MRRRTAALGFVGLLLASPLNLVLLRLLPQDSALPLVAVFLADGVGLLLAVRYLGTGVGASLATVANIPLLWWVGVPVAGPWAGLFAFPKYALLLAVGWSGWWRYRTENAVARWAGALAPTVSWLYIAVSPYVSDVLGRTG
jgi:hypothetical protein